jgi:SAM-dependent methyltransferase
MRSLRIYAQMLFRYRPRQFWNDLLSESFDLRGVGHFRLSEEENRRMYDAKRAALSAVVDQHAITIGPDTRALEIGCGVGYWTEYLQSRGVRTYTGNDITQISVSRLRSRFPEYQFIEGDAGSTTLPAATFDLALMIDVTQHITDDRAFARALANVWNSIVPGGVFLVTFWDPEQNMLMATKLRLNRIEKPRPLAAYTAVLGPSARILATVPFNDKQLVAIRRVPAA